MWWTYQLNAGHPLSHRQVHVPCEVVQVTEQTGHDLGHPRVSLGACGRDDSFREVGVVNGLACRAVAGVLPVVGIYIAYAHRRRSSPRQTRQGEELEWMREREKKGGGMERRGKYIRRRGRLRVGVKGSFLGESDTSRRREVEEGGGAGIYI